MIIIMLNFINTGLIGGILMRYICVNCQLQLICVSLKSRFNILCDRNNDNNFAKLHKYRLMEAY